ncbi:restriction endonuclease subunit S [Peptoniphilus duerdenii]|uniref:restriction endonuclease subunit S n=1 Tax=Peptoniphilus duerdenii TaxID=507750 RepID=UPI00288C351F|nr:restriction endonuclease subunit S [Peptoniphilus duerdenii]
MSKIDELLKDEKVEWKRLGDVSEIGTGKSNTNEQDESGEFPFYVRSKDIKRSKNYEFDETAIIIPGEGGIGEVFHYVIGKYALHQRAYRIHITDQNINTRFIYHYMKQNFKKYITKFAVSATVKSIRKPMIENFGIPIPPIETQEKIVKILDKFTECVTELQVELQAELQARIKQYEYYRDKLLSEEYLKTVSEKLDSFKNKNYFLRQTNLGEIGEFTNGFGMPKTMFNDDGEVGAIHYGHIYTKYNIFV